MSDNITIARPYAKAVFDLAKNTGTLEDWDIFLSHFSNAISESTVVFFIKNKTISYSDKSQVIVNFLKSCKFFGCNGQNFFINFVSVLAYYGRLLCVKDIYFLYKQYMHLELGCIEVSVSTAYSVNSLQKEQIVSSLSKKFNKKVSIFFELDKNLLGGFLVRIGDFVLDASIAGNLDSLRTKIML